MKALVIGATGATGKPLIENLLSNSAYHEVVAFTRKPIGIQHPKLKNEIINFSTPEQWKGLIEGDVAFSCLGTTLKDAGSKEEQWKIDYDYQYEFALNCKENQVSQFILVSANGANSQSILFYSKMKGQLEEEIKNLNFPTLLIFKPGMLVRKNTHRKGEKLTLKLLNFLNNVGILKSQKPLPTELLAEKMVKMSLQHLKGVHTFIGSSIFKL